MILSGPFPRHRLERMIWSLLGLIILIFTLSILCQISAPKDVLAIKSQKKNWGGQSFGVGVYMFIIFSNDWVTPPNITTTTKQVGPTAPRSITPWHWSPNRDPPPASRSHKRRHPHRAVLKARRCTHPSMSAPGWRYGQRALSQRPHHPRSLYMPKRHVGKLANMKGTRREKSVAKKIAVC